MGTTSDGLRYPEPTDRLNQGHVAIQNLANDVQRELPQNQQTATVTLESGWGIGSEGQNVRRVRLVSAGISVVSMTVNLVRTGSTITPAATGNLSDVEVFTLPSGYRPQDYIPVLVQVITKAPATGRITPSGLLAIQEQAGGSSIATSDELRVTATFLATI